MPLVQRSLATGKFFRQDAEPQWTDGDLWSETDTSPTGLFINNGGTALRIGSASLDETDESTIGTGGDSVNLPSLNVISNGAYEDIASVTFTPTSANNLILICGWAAWVVANGPRTGFLRVTETVDGDIIAEEEVTSSGFTCIGLQLTGSKSDVTAAEHTYTLQIKNSFDGGDITGIAGGLSIFGVNTA